MSTAQTIREAAVTWPMQYLSDEESRVLWAFCGPTFPVDWDSTEGRTYMLIVAASLDGGERVPMSDADASKLMMRWYGGERVPMSCIELVRLLDDYEDCPYQAARAVEQHHGIGVKP